MIKANELRIGNKIFMQGNTETVTGITTDSVMTRQLYTSWAY